MLGLVTLALVLSSALLVVVGLGAVLGGIGAVSGGRLGRCERCHRLGLGLGEGVHPQGCPERRSLVSQVQALAGGRHLRHH